MHIRKMFFSCNLLNLYLPVHFLIWDWVASLLVQKVRVIVHFPEKYIPGFSPNLSFFPSLLPFSFSGFSCFVFFFEYPFYHYSILTKKYFLHFLQKYSFYKSIHFTKVKLRSSDCDTGYFDIVAGVLQEDTLAPYLFIICLHFVLWTSIHKIKENGFKLTKETIRRYYLPTPPLGQDMTQGQFLSGV